MSHNNHPTQDHAGCCGGAQHQDGHHGHRQEVVVGPGDEVVTCAVRGNPTSRSLAESTGLVRDFQGERYHFCCGHCAELFDADPHAYATVS